MADRALAWAVRGTIVAPFVVIAHEGTHAAVSLAYGFGPVVIRFGSTSAAGIDPFLHGLDAGLTPQAAAAAAATSASCAITPTWAALLVSYGTAVACWVAVLRHVAVAGEAGRAGRLLAALGTTSAFRLAPIAMLVALARGSAFLTDDDPHLATFLGSATGHPTVWGVVLGLFGIGGIVLGGDMLRRVVSPSENWQVAWLALVGSFVCTVVLLGFLPAVRIG